MTSPETPLPPDPRPATDERTTLVEFLDFYRGVFVRKLEGLDDDQARRASCPPSDLTPLGLARHMAEVERGWFRRSLDEDVDLLFDYSEDNDAELHPGPDASMAEAIDQWRAEVVAARANLERFALDDLLPRGREPRKSVRWTVVHMIEEYARHCGHLDLICEAIDGRTGD
jgi:uncharacterized damage-inducible protein DinB